MKWNEDLTSQGIWAYVGHPRYTGFIGTVKSGSYSTLAVAHNKKKDSNIFLGTFRDNGKAVQRVERFFRESLHG